MGKHISDTSQCGGNILRTPQCAHMLFVDTLWPGGCLQWRKSAENHRHTDQNGITEYGVQNSLKLNQGVKYSIEASSSSIDTGVETTCSHLAD